MKNFLEHLPIFNPLSADLIDTQTDRHTNRQTDTKTDRQTDTQTNRQTDTQIDRLADKQTDHKQTVRQRQQTCTRTHDTPDTIS